MGDAHPMEPIFAYIDPGSGSLLIQGVIAALVALPVLFRNQIRRITGSLRHKDASDQASAATTEHQGEA